jgi:3-deoxy-7-phosphoheptulonate synthase
MDIQSINLTCPLVSRVNHSQNSQINIKKVCIGGKDLVVMAGPCAVESEEQIMSIAASIKASGAQILRGGAFKPRTSPYSFQGMGEAGLILLRKAGEAFDLPVVTELMDADDLDLINEYADIIQIGARNMQNFSLLKRVGKAGKPVMLKRGLSATLEEFLMAAEYIMASGNEQVILCERGIRTFETHMRNTLDLNVVTAVKELSHLPIIIDPSHATGKWEMVAPLSRAAVAIGADGLMIEVHDNPKLALSDGPQSLKPERFSNLMVDLQSIHGIIGKGRGWQ